MRTGEFLHTISKLDNNENLEVKVTSRISMGSHEEVGDLIIERIKTPDYILITKVFEPRSTEEIRKKK